MTVIGFNRSSVALGDSCYAVAESFNFTTKFFVTASSHVVKIKSTVDDVIKDLGVESIQLAVEHVNDALMIASNASKLKVKVLEAESALDSARSQLHSSFLNQHSKVVHSFANPESMLRSVLHVSKEEILDNLIELLKSFFQEGEAPFRRQRQLSSTSGTGNRTSDHSPRATSRRAQAATVSDASAEIGEVTGGVNEKGANVKVQLALDLDIKIDFSKDLDLTKVENLLKLCDWIRTHSGMIMAIARAGMSRNFSAIANIAKGGDYDKDQVGEHGWAGGLVGWLAGWFEKKAGRQNRARLPASVVRVCCVCACVCARARACECL